MERSLCGQGDEFVDLCLLHCAVGRDAVCARVPGRPRQPRLRLGCGEEAAASQGNYVSRVRRCSRLADMPAAERPHHVETDPLFAARALIDKSDAVLCKNLGGDQAKIALREAPWEPRSAFAQQNRNDPEVQLVD